MRKAERKIIEKDGFRYTLGEPDYPKIRKYDLFHSGGGIYRCKKRKGNMIEYSTSFGLWCSDQNTLCRKVLIKEPLEPTKSRQQ